VRRKFRASTAIALSLALTTTATSAANAPRLTPGEAAFRVANPCPVTGVAQGPCKGYVVDRIIPAICGGADDASNMRWLTLAEAKAKARWDRIGCRPGRKLVLPGDQTSSTEAFGTGESGGAVRGLPLPVGASGPVEPAPAPSAEETEAPEQELPHQ
jgi:hypothetical protein